VTAKAALLQLQPVRHLLLASWVLLAAVGSRLSQGSSSSNLPAPGRNRFLEVHFMAGRLVLSRLGLVEWPGGMLLLLLLRSWALIKVP
jgi:hypothetical protein